MEPSPKQGDTEPTAPHKDASATENDKVDAVAERVVAALVKINRTNRKADAAENERNHRREQRRFKVEIIEIILIAVYAIVTIFEWRTFDSERQIMEREFQASQIASERQLQEIRQSRTLDERAWLVASEFTLDQSEVGVEKFVVTVKNTGKTPAMNSEVKIVSTSDIKAIPQQDSDVMPESSFAVVAPNAVQSTFVKEPIDVIKAVGVFYIYGTVWYDDIFGKHHWSQFCYTIKSETNNSFTIGPSAIHNACDSIETNQTN